MLAIPKTLGNLEENAKQIYNRGGTSSWHSSKIQTDCWKVKHEPQL